ncbi:MAG: MFS transporter [Candidatus Krumholzibacteria bacterium]|nr:MFS transporter [Candidatus Krumholzibacteria bacterium]
MSTEDRLSFKEKFGYGLGDTASNLYFQMFINFLLFFYTDVFGIPAAVAGTLFMVSRFWDAVNDPIMGIIADRTGTRWGKFRPYLLWMMLPLAIVGVLTFTTPELSLQGKIVYAYVTYILMMMAYTAINIPYSALLGVLSPHSEQRTSASTYRFVLAFVGAFIVQGATLPLVNSLGEQDRGVSVSNGVVRIQEIDTRTSRIIVEASDGSHATSQEFLVKIDRPGEAAQAVDEPRGTADEALAAPADTPGDDPPAIARSLGNLELDEGFGEHEVDISGAFVDPEGAALTYTAKKVDVAKGFQYTLVIYGVLACILFYLTFALTRERVQPSKDQQASLRKDLGNLLRNRPWMILLVMSIFTLGYVIIRMGTILYYFKYYIGNELLAALFMVTGTVAVILGVACTSFLSKRLGKKRLYLIVMLLASLFTMVFYHVPKDRIALVFAVHILISFVMAPQAPLLWAMYADTVDYSEWKHGRRATGLIFSAATFSQKFGMALGGGLAGWLLARFGFEPNVAQGPETLTGIRLMMSYIPAAATVIAVVAAVFYELDDKTMKKIEDELAVRRAAQA